MRYNPFQMRGRFHVLAGGSAAAALTAGMLVSGLGLPGASAAPVTDDLPTINITMDDPVASHNTMSYLSASKDNKIPAKISVEDPSGAYNITEVSGGEIKGRGNYTFSLPKKPFQIKFDKSTPLLGMETAKTWILLANHADASLMRNKLAYDLAASIGMPYAPQSRFVDVRVNGQYQGSYLATEKAEVKKNRVDLKDPQGVLAELDNNYGTAEDYYFYTGGSKSLFVLKDGKAIPDADANNKAIPLPTKANCAEWSPKDLNGIPVTKGADQTCLGWYDMRETLNKLDGLLKSGKPDWNAISSMIDVDSFVNFYFVHELAENPEIVASSIYFYKDGPTDKLHAGSVWDFDSSLGNYDKSESLGAFTNSDYVKNASTFRKDRPNGSNPWFSDLFRNPEFVQRTNEMWQAGVGYHVSQLPAKIEGYRNQVKHSAANNFSQRWTSVQGKPTLLIRGEGKNYATTYNAEVEYLKTWVSARYNFMNKNYGAVPLVTDKAQVAELGWLNVVNNGQIAGTTAQLRRLEAFSLGLSNSPVSGTIEARSHVQNIGWSGWTGSSLVGTTGRSLRLEAFQLRLTGTLASKYQVSYRAHVQDIGWQGWTTDGITAGTVGLARRIEAVQVRLLLKSPGTPQPGATPTASATATPTVSPAASATPTQSPTPIESATPTETAISTETPTTTETATPEPSETTPGPTTAPPIPSITPSPSPTQTVPITAKTAYSSQVQNIGWMPTVFDGAIAGTVGRGLRLETLKLKVTSTGHSGDIKFCGHVQNVGWQTCVNSAGQIGTTGQGLRLEAFTIQLTGDLAKHYRIKYQAHVQDIGWQSYVADGATAGTLGKSKRIEAVRIALEPK